MMKTKDDKARDEGSVGCLDKEEEREPCVPPERHSPACEKSPAWPLRVVGVGLCVCGMGAGEWWETQGSLCR